MTDREYKDEDGNHVTEQFSLEWAPSEVTEDITTSALPSRLAEDGDHIREYSPVLHDRPVRETPAMAGNGKRFGTNLLPEPISMSLDNTKVYLAAFYGFDTAESMLMRALSTGTVVNGAVFKVQDTQAVTKGKMSVTTDKSRPGDFVIVLAVLRQSGGAKK